MTKFQGDTKLFKPELKQFVLSVVMAASVIPAGYISPFILLNNLVSVEGGIQLYGQQLSVHDLIYKSFSMEAFLLFLKTFIDGLKHAVLRLLNHQNFHLLEK